MLYNKLKEYSTFDAIKFEQKDRQFIALKDLYENKKMSNENYLFLIIVNSIICYQLSGKGENYWEEFSENLKNKEFSNFFEIYNFFEKFLRESKNNRRFIDTKLKRVKKIESFYENFLGQSEYFYKNMDLLVLDLSKIMNQKMEAKTIVFAVKMFSYGARNIYDFEYFPENIMIPIDSRLENLYKKENPHLASPKGEEQKISNKEVKEFYINLSKKLKIPLLHLDAILWVNYEELIKKILNNKKTMNLKNYISEITDFPKPGINFKDISPILENFEALDFVINSFEIANSGKINKIVGLDARGFIFGSILAYKMKLPFIMLRKKGKLPGECEEISYDLEYGSNTFEIQKVAIKSGDKVAIVDDLLATGGSAKAAIDLIEKLGGIIESLNFVIELEFLNGKEKFGDKKVVSLVKY